MELSDEYFRELINIDPTIGDFFLVNKKPDYQPNIYSSKYINLESKIIQKYIQLITDKETLSHYDKLLKYELDDIEQSIEFRHELLPINLADNIYITYIQQCTGNYNYRFKTDKDYLNFINRLESIPSITKSIIRNLNKGILNRITHPKVIINRLIEYFNHIINEKLYIHKKSHKYTKLLNNKIEDLLIKSIQKVIYYLESKYINYSRETIGYCNLINGKEYYKSLIRYYTLPTLTPNKLVTIAKNELPKVLKHINSIKNKMKFRGDYNEFIYYILNRNDNRIHSKKELFNHIDYVNNKINKNVIRKYFNNNGLNLNYKVKLMSKIEPLYSPYFTQYFKNRIGYFHINFDSDILIDKYELYILLLHEGNPGHNYESLHPSDSDYVLSNYYPGYSEGWAFYCEQLYNTEDLNINLYKYIYELHRIIRLFIDTGIHYYNWDMNRCINFMKRYCFMHQNDIIDEILRYISTPGQALTYYIGRSMILDYRDKYLKKYPKDINGYHNLLLEIGPCPLIILEDRLKSYLK